MPQKWAGEKAASDTPSDLSSGESEARKFVWRSSVARKRAAIAVAKLGKGHFPHPVLSVFRVKVPGQGLLFLLSETPDPRVQSLADRLEADLGEEAEAP
jgi:hypothetical protein